MWSDGGRSRTGRRAAAPRTRERRRRLWAVSRALRHLVRIAARQLHSQAEQAEWDRRQKETLLESATEGIYGIDLRGRCMFVNSSAARMLGYTAAELEGRLRIALEQVPLEQREVLLLRTQAGLSFEEIGRHQGISANTARGRYRYGIDKLRSLLNSELEP